MAMTVMQNILL